eukprot:IDg9919t1
MKSIAPKMTLRQSVPFRSFTELNNRRGRFRPIQRQCLTTPYRSLSGFCNNRRNPSLGSADTVFELVARPVTLNFNALPNARMISNIVCEEAKPVKNARGMSELVTFFGQFVDHTVTETVVDVKKPLPIKVPAGDIVFATTQFIPFSRSVTEGTGNSRSPLNRLSSYLDAASVYSVDEKIAKSLRSMKGGRMKTPGGLLTARPDGFFISGDDRVNENPNLTSLHLLFTLEHNKIAAVIEKAFPTLNDEKIYQLARHVLIAEFQAIVFFEFLPALVGRKLPAYSGYKESTRA